MPKRQASLSLDLPLLTSIAVCRQVCEQAVGELGWTIAKDSESGLVCKERYKLSFNNPVKIEISYFATSPEITTVKLKGSNHGMGPIQSSHLDKQVTYFLSSIEHLAAKEMAKNRLDGQPGRPAQEGLDLFNRAADKWNSTDESNRDTALARDVAALLALAITKARAPFPRAHSWLAVFLQRLGDQETALYHSNLALKQDPNEFRAQLVRVDAALSGVWVKKLAVSDFLTGGDSIESAVAGSVVKGLSSLGGAAYAALTQTNFRNELDRLTQVFRNACQTNTDVEEFVYMAEAMISLGDLIEDVPIAGGRPNLYAEVVNAPIADLELEGRESEVVDVRDRAHGRAILFKG